MRIKSSNDIRESYNKPTEICRRKDDLATAERLLEAEHARRAGASGYSVAEFKQNMADAIVQGQ